MLLEGFLVIRLAEFGRGGDALDHGLGGAADDDVGELGHDGSFRERSFPFASYGAYCILYIVYNQEETGSFSELLKRGWWVSFGDGEGHAGPRIPSGDDACRNASANAAEPPCMRGKRANAR